MMKAQKCSLVCFCQTPPSVSCRESIQSRFQRISARVSGSLPPGLGDVEVEVLEGFGVHLQAQSSVPVEMPELTT